MPQDLISGPDAEVTSPREPESGIDVFGVIRVCHFKGQKRIRVAHLIGDGHEDAFGTEGEAGLIAIRRLHFKFCFIGLVKMPQKAFYHVPVNSCLKFGGL